MKVVVASPWRLWTLRITRWGTRAIMALIHDEDVRQVDEKRKYLK
jgi:hypothetical protein